MTDWRSSRRSCARASHWPISGVHVGNCGLEEFLMGARLQGVRGVASPFIRHRRRRWRQQILALRLTPPSSREPDPGRRVVARLVPAPNLAIDARILEA